MSHPTPSPFDQPHATTRSHDVANAAFGSQAPRGVSGWWLGLLALLPIACCALPLLIVAGASAGSGAVLGGVGGVVLMLIGAAVFGLWAMRRRAQSSPGEPSPSTSPSRDRCC